MKQAKFWGLVFAGFLIALIVLPHYEGFSFYVTRVLSPFVCLLVFMNCKDYMVRLPKEFYFYVFFVIWCFSGFFVARDMQWFWDYITLIVQIAFLMFIVIIFILKYRAVEYVFGALISVAIILLSNTIITGEIYSGYGAGSMDQLEGLVKNANVFGYYMFLGLVGVMFFLKRVPKFGKWKVILIAFAGSFMIAILFSGSRKSFLIAIFFILCWVFFCQRKLIRSRLKFLIYSIAIMACVYSLFTFAMENTFLGDRLKRVDTIEKVTDLDRFGMYIEGLDMFAFHPITGVGLGNFITHSSTEQYSHSDYIEVLSTTGLVGFILYFSIFLVFWMHLSKIQGRNNDEGTAYAIGFSRAVIISMLLLGLGIAHFLELTSMILLAALMGQASFIESVQNREAHKAFH